VGKDQELLLTHYLRFVLRDESGPLRERLQRGLVERALKTSNSAHTMTPTAIKARIEQLTSLADYPPELVADALEALRQRGQVEVGGVTDAGETRYRLAYARWSTLDEALASVEEQERDFEHSVVAKVEAAYGRVSRDEKLLIERAFVGLLGSILSGLGERCARTLLEKKRFSSTETLSFNQELREALKPLPSELASVARAAFEDTLRNPSREDREHLYAMGQSFYVAELLHLDPQLQLLQRARFEETSMFLDTNLLLQLLLKTHPGHHSAVALVRLCRHAGLNLRYGAATGDELERLIANADDEFKKAKVDYSMAHAYADLMDNPFVAEFLRSWQQHRLSWGQHRVRLAAWRGELEKEGVMLDPELQTINHGHRFEDLKEALTPKARQLTASTKRVRRPRAVEHDAGVVAGVEALIAADTSEAHPFGHRYWFITNDRHLAETARRRSHSAVGPVVMMGAEWVQYVAPFLGPDVSRQEAADVFSSLLSSRLFVSLGASLTLEDLQIFTTPEVEKILGDLTLAQRCAAVAKAAQAGVFARGRGQDPDEAALRELAKLVEDDLETRTGRGELVSRAQMEKRVDDQRRLALEGTAEKAAEISRLNRDLEEARRHNRSSLTYWLARMRIVGKRRYRRLRSWVGGRITRLLIAAGSLIAFIAVLTQGWGGIALSIALAALAIIAFVCTDFNVGKRNLRRLFRI
jgi:predicted nucleic acid-binding protein